MKEGGWKDFETHTLDLTWKGRYATGKREAAIHTTAIRCERYCMLFVWFLLLGCPPKLLQVRLQLWRLSHPNLTRLPFLLTRLLLQFSRVWHAAGCEWERCGCCFRWCRRADPLRTRSFAHSSALHFSGCSCFPFLSLPRPVFPPLQSASLH